jgi:UDP-galactopyranose mutase
VVCYEYPSGTGDPYYPVPSHAARTMYSQYRELADVEKRERGVYFAGRLGNYCYINSDQAVEGALSVAQEILVAAERTSKRA